MHCGDLDKEPKILVASLPDVLNKYNLSKIFEYIIRIFPQMMKTDYFVGKHMKLELLYLMSYQ